MSSSETWLSVERVRDDQKESTLLDCRLMKNVSLSKRNQIRFKNVYGLKYQILLNIIMISRVRMGLKILFS